MTETEELWREIRILKLQIAGLVGILWPGDDVDPERAERRKQALRLVENREFLERAEEIDRRDR